MPSLVGSEMCIRDSEFPFVEHRVECGAKGDVGAGYGGGTRATVRFQRVAVDPERPIVERGEVHHRAQRPADEPLDLHGAASGPAEDHLAGTARGRRAGQHRVLRRHPSPVAPFEEVRHTVLVGNSAYDPRAPELDQHGALRVGYVISRYPDRPYLVGFSTVRPYQKSLLCLPHYCLLYTSDAADDLLC